MRRRIWLPFVMSFFCLFSGLYLAFVHNEAGNRRNNTKNRLRSSILLYDVSRIRVVKLPIRRSIHPQLFKADSRDRDFYRDIARLGWSLGDKSDGSPLEPAEVKLANMYRDVDESAADLDRLAPLYYIGYGSLVVIFICSLGYAIAPVLRRRG